MQEFRATTKKEIKVIIDDAEYVIRKPKVSDQRRLNEMLKEVPSEGPEQVDIMMKWLSSLGLPEEVVNNMYQVDLIHLIQDFLIDDPKKK